MNNNNRYLTGRPVLSLSASVVGCVLASGLAACSAPAAPSDRAGGDTLVLHLASSDGEGVDQATYHGPTAFMEALEEVSDGRLKVEIEWDYAGGAADAETQLVEAIVSGEVDGGWPATRAFARAGIEGLDAVEAPMVLTSEEAVEQLVSGDVADDVLAPLDGTGVTGLGLMAAPLRRPVGAAEPVVAPEDWDGITFRVYNSDVQAAAVEALGAEAVDMTHAWVDALHVGDLDGGEADIVTSNLPEVVGNITSNVVLWPKVFVTTLNEELFDSLSDQQQEWVQEAADRARDASVAAPYDASVDLLSYCDRGTAVHEATEAQVAALREKVAPVLDELRQNPESADLMAAVESVAAQYPDTDTPSPAGGCDGKTPAAGDGLPTGTAPIPDGIYRSEIPVDATVEVGNGPGWSGTWTLEIEDGTFALTCRPLDAPGNDCGNSITDEILEAGYLRGDNEEVWFVGDGAVMAELTGCTPADEPGPDVCFVLEPYGATWQIDGEELVFPEAFGPDPYYHLSLLPWQRVDE